ncbi:MAG TPA: alpha/beta fold hydrolase [Gemmatimonadales bacterium]|nr:alpha/beta fold hydrolase [Gemmatimonadales bacterium]
MRLLRLFFRGVQWLSPRAAARIAERVFFTPRRSRLTPAMRAVLDRGTGFQVEVEGRRIVGWSWGAGPAVYLVHGWGSRGGRLSAFVQPLVDAGFRVIAFDAIGHGASSGRMSSMVQMARTLRAVVLAHGPAHGVVAHSLGASVTTLTMEWGLAVGRAVFVAPSADPVGYTLLWARQLGLRPEVIDRLRTNSERRIGFSWSDLDIVALARRRTTPLLAIHDDTDVVIPWADGSAIAGAWPGGRLVTTHGLGHSEIVRAPDIVAQGVAFLAHQESSEAASARTPSATRSASAMIVK